MENETAARIVNSPFLEKGISIAELGLAVTTVVIGNGKVNEFLGEYKKRRMCAVCGFYVNLGYFVKRIRSLTISNSGKPMRALYFLSPSAEIRNQAKGYEELGNLLATTAYECLQYLSKESNQVPPSQEASIRQKWKERLGELVDYLNQFCIIKKGSCLPVLETEEGIASYCRGIKAVLDDIEKITEDAMNSFYRDLEKE